MGSEGEQEVEGIRTGFRRDRDGTRVGADGRQELGRKWKETRRREKRD